MLLHRSQTHQSYTSQSSLSGILCFYIVLKRQFHCHTAALRLASYAFTSFSNAGSYIILFGIVWHLMLLHRSQTRQLLTIPQTRSDILCFYIVLKLRPPLLSKIFGFGILCFYIILKQRVRCCEENRGLVSYVFTSFSNICRAIARSL